MYVLGVLIGKCDEVEGTERICELFSDCPYNIINDSEDRFLTSVFYIPEDHSWWLEEIKKNPEGTIGLKEVDVFFSDKFDDLFNIEVEKDLEEAPCGTVCEDCEFYRDECTGCPSTVYYLGG